ncbi:hypothetical protein LCGC14_1209840 [marine sediment metagenome]|uniref:Zinc-ribbon domain-containing protein n=1 Tax=marine sediment metagenome TaxID=412755 RepID=A0A0F9M1V4_9ZZZZ
MYRRKKTSDERIADIIAFVIAGGAALGVYGLVFLSYQSEIAAMLPAMITFIVVFIPVWCFKGSIKRTIWGIGKKKHTSAQPEVQKRTSFDGFKYCIKCGSEMKKEVKICTKCGQPFQL